MFVKTIKKKQTNKQTNKQTKAGFCCPFVWYKIQSNYKIICQDNAAVMFVYTPAWRLDARCFVGKFSQPMISEFKIRDQI